MKRFISFATALIICLGLASCGKNDPTDETVGTGDVNTEVQTPDEVKGTSDETEESEEPADETEEPSDEEEPAEEEPTESQPPKEYIAEPDTETPVAPPVNEDEKTEDEKTETSPEEDKAPEVPADTPAVPVIPPAPEKQPESEVTLTQPEVPVTPAEPVTPPAEPTPAQPEVPAEPEQPEVTETPTEPEAPAETEKTEENVSMENFKNTYSEYNNYRAPLAHTYKKLTEDKELTVVYFGGSVTAGHGSSDREKYSWRALVGQWLDSHYPDAEIEHINRAVGESGTYLGTHRVQLDVIDSEPDLMFLEYSINDKYYGSSYEKAASQYETIVREVRKALPNTDIVTILVTDTGCLLNNKMGKLHTQAQAHEDIAQKYNIPTIHVGRYLAKVANYSVDEFRGTYAIDIVHLTDAGNAVYFECIEEFMHNSLLATDFTNIPDEPKPRCERNPF